MMVAHAHARLCPLVGHLGMQFRTFDARFSLGYVENTFVIN